MDGNDQKTAHMLYARGQKLLRLVGDDDGELPERLCVSRDRWGQIVVACSQRVVTLETIYPETIPAFRVEC